MSILSQHSIRATILTVGLLWSEAAFAATDITQILANLRAIVNPLAILALTISFVSGIWFLWKAIGMLRKFGAPLTQMSQQGELAGPLVHFVVGVILIYLPTSSDIVMKTIFDTDFRSMFTGSTVSTLNFNQMGKASTEILGVVKQGGLETKWGDLINTLVLYIQFIGLIAFLRGWFILAKAGNPGVQPGTVGKGLTHVVGGVIAINLVPMFNIMRATIFQ